MFNPLKLKLRIKVIVAIAIALVVSFFYIKPKENNIPTVPVTLQLNVTQQSDNILALKDISIVQKYAPDYQTELQDNYYLIEMKKDKDVLFSGKMVKRPIVIHEWLYEDPRNEVEEKQLRDFSLYLPYFKDATTLVLTEDSGKEVLRIDLTSKNLSMPVLKNTCGDGVCTDNENVLMCYTDCKYLLFK